MTRRLVKLLPIAVALAVSSAGCVVVEHDPDADLTFFWDFEGYDCLGAGVNQTLVQIWDGSYLEAEQYVPCDATGVTLEAFVPGDYSYYLAGISPSGATVYEASGSIHADSGSNVYDVRLWFAGH